MNPATGNFLMMDTYEGSIYDPDTLHKYMYANGNPVMYSDPSGNMFDFSSSVLGMGIESILNNAVQICYRGVITGLTCMILTAVMGESWEDAKSSFIAGFILGAGISAVRYFAVGAELVTLARFYVLSASANFIFSATMTVFAVTKGYSNLAITFSVMMILSIAEWCWAYGNYLLIDVYGNKGSATIECNPSGGEIAKNTLPNVEKATINPNKLTGYALNPEHPVGGNKAKVFESALGYNQSNAEDLMKQIYEKLPQNEAILGELDQYGQRYTVDILITGPNGNTVNVRTGWIIKTGSDVPELTTIFVK